MGSSLSAQNKNPTVAQVHAICRAANKSSSAGTACRTPHAENVASVVGNGALVAHAPHQLDIERDHEGAAARRVRFLSGHSRLIALADLSHHSTAAHNKTAPETAPNGAVSGAIDASAQPAIRPPATPGLPPPRLWPPPWRHPFRVPRG